MIQIKKQKIRMYRMIAQIFIIKDNKVLMVRQHVARGNIVGNFKDVN